MFLCRCFSFFVLKSASSTFRLIMAGNEVESVREETKLYTDLNTILANMDELVKTELAIDFSRGTGAPEYQPLINQQNATNEADKEMRIMIKESVLHPRIRYGDGDQTPVRGTESTKLKYMWGMALDWQPLLPLASHWMRYLSFGDYDKVMEYIDSTPKSEMEQLLERRETLLNFSALFHVCKGAMSYCQEGTQEQSEGYEKTLSKLIELGANIEARDFAGFTPFMYCVTSCYNLTTLELAKILLKHGANINTQNRIGETALVQTVLTKKLEVVKFLLDNGADMTIQDNDGRANQTAYYRDEDLSILFAKARKQRSKELRQMEGGLMCRVCEKHGSLRCTACYVTRYCSKDCQKFHWRKHKVKCKQIQKQYEHMNLILPDQASESQLYNTAYNQDSCPITRIANTGSSKHRFVVKIQIQFSDTGIKMREMCSRQKESPVYLFLYNKEKTIYGEIAPTEPVYDKLVETIKSKGVFGDKGFFFVIQDKDGNLKINAQEILPPRLW